MKQIKGAEIAKAAFMQNIQKCQTEEELADYAAIMVAMASHLLRGIKGDQFTKEFLQGAILDKTKMTAHRKQ